MRQHSRFKAMHPDCILFFRMGDFYELFDDDAKLVSKVLGLTLTERTSGIPMAGVPYHAVESYIRRLIEQGYRVAICDQIQDPKEAKGVVDRAVTRVLTPGTLVDEPLLDDARDNLIAAIRFLESGDQSAAVMAIVELSTGRFTLMDLSADQVLDEIARVRPSELLYVETADGGAPPRVQIIRDTVGCALTPRPSWSFRPSDALGLLLEHYQVTTLKGFGFDDDDPALSPAGALLRYLQETQSPDAISVSGGGGGGGSGSGSGSGASERLAHLRPPRRESSEQYLTIDAASLASLEIERTMRTGSHDGSLLSVLSHCSTSMGKRLLRRWLHFPRRDRQTIVARQNAVAVLLADQQLAERLGEEISHVQDVARIAGRMAMNRATPRDLTALGASVARISAVAEHLEGVPAFASARQRLEAIVNSLQQLSDTILQRCEDHPPAHLREGGLFREGVDAELDEARGLQRDANAWLAAYQKRLHEQTGINSLKVGYNKVFGYYIEITHAHVDKIPIEFNRKQTLKNAERYITPELKEFEDKVLTAQSRAIEREKLLFDRLCAQAAALAAQLAAYADIVAELDVLLCFAHVAIRFDYVRPQLVEESILDIRQGRHVVLDRTLGEKFVPNDCILGVTPSDDATETSSLALITGPNMAGKSTAIRQVALIVLLAHTGCYVPAESATIGLTDRIFTRIGASDELHTGQSTFMVEMTETANILNHATPRSLVILDEIGRGTSTLDGLALAWAIAETLAGVGCRTLFATHYHELTTLADQFDNVTNLHVSVREWGEQIIFLYRILPGRTDRSYGIHVAQIAGLPGNTIQRAKQLLDTLAVQSESTAKPVAPPAAPGPGAQLDLFTEYIEHPVLDALREVEVNTLSPLDAFEMIRRLSEAVAGDRDAEGSTPGIGP